MREACLDRQWHQQEEWKRLNIDAASADSPPSTANVTDDQMLQWNDQEHMLEENAYIV